MNRRTEDKEKVELFLCRSMGQVDGSEIYSQIIEKYLRQ